MRELAHVDEALHRLELLEGVALGRVEVRDDGRDGGDDHGEDEAPDELQHHHEGALAVVPRVDVPVPHRRHGREAELR